MQQVSAITLGLRGYALFRRFILHGRKFVTVGLESVGPGSVGSESVGPESVGPEWGENVSPKSVGPESVDLKTVLLIAWRTLRNSRTQGKRAAMSLEGPQLPCSPI